MKIHFAESKYDRKLSPEYVKLYKKEIEKAYKEVTKLLPFGSRRINFFVQPRTFYLIEPTGDNARTMNKEFIELAFDPTRDKKALKVILDGVKHSVYHEMSHAARFNISIWHKTFLDNCVLEGLATVFTRDYANEDARWAKYPKNVKDWLQEIIDKNDMFYWEEYMFSHPDGRKEIGYKVGTYIIDEAIKNSGKSVIELTKMECKDILKLAKIILPKNNEK
jgi:uncharacterized protein YjaZ